MIFIPPFCLILSPWVELTDPHDPLTSLLSDSYPMSRTLWSSWSSYLPSVWSYSMSIELTDPHDLLSREDEVLGTGLRLPLHPQPLPQQGHWHHRHPGLDLVQQRIYDYILQWFKERWQGSWWSCGQGFGSGAGVFGWSQSRHFGPAPIPAPASASILAS